MPSYFSMGTNSSEFVSQRYLHINNCGFNEALDHSRVARPNGRRDYQLIYIKSGRIVFETDGQKLPLGAGHIFLYRPGIPQYYSVDAPDTTFFWIHFTGTAVEELLSFFTGDRICTGDFPEFERYCKAFYRDRQLIHRFNALYYEGALISLFSAIAEKADGSATCRHHFEKIDAALLAMNSSLSNRLSNQALAALCGLNRHYFIKLFKQATGLTPQQYYARLVVEKSRALLESTDCSVNEIAAMCGVEDSFYFSRLFKKHMGISPTAYRRNIH